MTNPLAATTVTGPAAAGPTEPAQAACHRLDPFTVRATFDSDWIIGSGQAVAPSLDRAVLLDSDGLPCLPASSLIGLLRERALTVVGALRSDAPPEIAQAWTDWHTWLFGSEPALEARHSGHDRPAPVSAALGGSALHLEAAVREGIRRLPDRSPGATGPPGRQQVMAAARLLRPGVRIDADLGTAMEDFLRVEERARRGLVVEATDWSLDHSGGPTNPALVWPALLLLETASRLLTAVGGQRRRGAGRVRLRITATPSEDGPDSLLPALPPRPDPISTATAPGPADRLAAYLERLAEGAVALTLDPTDHPGSGQAPVGAAGKLLLPPPPARLVPTKSPAPRPERERSRLRHRVDLDITVVTPVVVSPTVAGNVVTSDRVIPGAALLPLLRTAFGVDLASLIRTGRLVVTPAHVVHDGRRCQPWPLALGHLKHGLEHHFFYDAARPLEPLRGYTDDFLSWKEQIAYQVAVDLVSQAHAVVDDAPTDQADRDQSPYNQVGIAPATRLRAEIWLSDDVAFQPPLGPAGQARLGTSRKNDYGLVELAWAEPSESEPVVSDLTPDRPVTLMAASDWLLTDTAGQPVSTVDGVLGSLSEALGLPLALAEPAAAACRFIRRESWQTAWGLPRPSLLAVAAGSLFRVRADRAIPAASLDRLVRSGLGQRRAEGYGRLQVDPWSFQPGDRVEVKRCRPTGETGRPAGATPNTDPITGPPSLLLLTRAAWSEAIIRAARTAARGKMRKRYLPATTSTAQLGRLRQLLTGIGSGPESAQVLRRWLENLDQVPQRKAAWSDCRAALGALLDPKDHQGQTCWDSGHPIWNSLFASSESDRPSDLSQWLTRLPSEDVTDLTIFAVQAFLFEVMRLGGQDRQATRAEGELR